jgi:hypothetical protein
MVSVVGTIILKSGNVSLSVIWFFVSLASPWLVSAAKNLYWVPWTWLLPLAISGFIFFARKRAALIALHLLLFTSLFLRFAAGYEFASSIILMVALFPIVLMKSEDKSLVKTGAMGIGLSSPLALVSTSTLAFLATFSTHSFMRGSGDLSKGAIEIIIMDVLRITQGDPAEFDEVFSGSLKASTLEVVVMYFANETQ